MNNQDILIGYMKSQKENERRPNTLKNKTSIIKRLIDYIADKSLSQVDVMMLEDFLRQQHIQKSSRKVYLINLRKFFQYLISRELMTKNPAEVLLGELGKVKKNGKDENGKDKKMALTLDEVKKLLRATLNPRDRAILMLLAKTGIRQAEVTHIRVPDVDFKNMTIYVSDRKGGKDSLLPMDVELAQSLQMAINIRGAASCKDDFLFTSYLHAGLTPLMIWHIVKKAGERAGIKIHTHMFRHTFTTFLSENRCLPAVIEKLRGDEPTNMTGYYTHLDFEVIRKEYLASMPNLL
ncbi:MAG: hypothetical protein FIB08_03645 [Candidatus Methanoperedens sp.]|nr:hypothetical protein [Candidatus Methanoperedens sp.]